MIGVRRDLSQRRGGQDRDARRNAVAAIHKVDRVGEEDDPEHRDQRRNDTEADVRPQGQSDLVDPVAGCVHGDRGAHLRHQFGGPTQHLQVVEKSDGEDERAGAQKGNKLGGLGRKEFRCSV